MTSVRRYDSAGKHCALLYATSGILGYQVADGTLCSEKVKARYPELPMLIGGWFASTAPELVLASGLYDAVALGQGEITFRELVRAIDAGEALDGIAGLALWRDGAVVRTAPRLAVGWGELDDLQQLQERFGFDVVRFYDANWAVMEKRVRTFAQGVVDRGLKFHYYPYMQSESIVRASPSTLDLFAASGMYVGLLGAETGTDETMTALKKTTRGDHNLEAAVELDRRGIVVHLSYIIGFPGETAASMCATLDQMRRVQVACPRSNPTVWPYLPCPGTPLFAAAVELGYVPPRTLVEWGDIGDYRHHETWRGRIPPEILRERKLLGHYATLSRGLARSKFGWWERHARWRLERGDWRFGAIEAKAFDLYHRLVERTPGRRLEPG